MKGILLAVTTAILAAGGTAIAAEPPSRYVDPLIGTLTSRLPHTEHGGNTLPAATLPHGMVQWGPTTTAGPRDPRAPQGYYHDADTVTGFPLAQMSGAGCGSHGYFPVMPLTDAAQANARYSHADEQAAPGYYGLRLASGVRAEFTATLRGGFARFQFPAGAPALLVVDATHTHSVHRVGGAVLTAVSPTALSATAMGGNFCESRWTVPVHLFARFDQPYTVHSRQDGKAVLEFPAGSTVLMKAALSYVSVANAEDNMARENAGWDFQAVRRAAAAAWDARLSAIEVEGGTRAARTKFYTALYHVMWGPTVFSDANGEYAGMDGKPRRLAPGQGAQYTNVSAWDSYRSQIPLQALLAPRETGDMAQSLLNNAQQCGSFPSWVNAGHETGVMPGAPGALVVTQAHAFGARSFDAQAALAVLRRLGNLAGTACQGTVTMPGNASYLRLGYIAQGEWVEAEAPADRNWPFCRKRSRYANRCNADGEIGPASTTREYGVADFAAARFALALGDTRAYRQWLARAGAWRSLLSQTAPRQLVARYADGSWGNPADSRDYVEGSAEQYLWMVPYDGAGLLRELGGAVPARARLDRFFSEVQGGPDRPYHYMGNEPSFAVPWLYNWAGAPARTQDTVRRIMETAFGAGPDGLPGNDDLGAMSGWYVWAAMGLYPAIPGVGGLALSSPQFPRIIVHLGNGKRIEIRAPGAADRHYIQGLRLNGKPQRRAWLDLEPLLQGARLDFTMGAGPAPWGAAAAPPSFGVPALAGAAAANSQGIGVEGSVNADGGGADFDGRGRTYAGAALAAAGAAAGADFIFGGARFRWPPAGLDHVVAVGQQLLLERPAKGSALVLLAAANDGPASGQASIDYADGGRTEVTLTVDDWTLNGGADQPGAPVALDMPYRLGADGRREEGRTCVFGVRLALDPRRPVRGITLPGQTTAGRIHVFGIAPAP